MKYIHNREEAIIEPHFAILEFGSILIPGDERSRTNPGHGYPEHREDKIDYIVFKDEGEWKVEIAKRMINNDHNFVPVKIIPAVFRLKTEVEVINV